MATLSESATTALQLVASLDPALLSVVARSLAVSALACLRASAVGLGLGAWLGAAQFKGRDALLAVLNTFLAGRSLKLAR